MRSTSRYRAKRKRCGASSFTFSEGKYFTRRRRISPTQSVDFTPAKQEYHCINPKRIYATACGWHYIGKQSFGKVRSTSRHRAKRKRCEASSFTFSAGKYFTRQRRISPMRSIDFTHSEGMNFTESKALTAFDSTGSIFRLSSELYKSRTAEYYVLSYIPRRKQACLKGR